MTESRPVAVVTGAASGMGRALAERLASDGYDVVAVDLGTQASALEQTVANAEANGARAVAATADVSAIDDLRAVADRTLAEFGRVDLVANIAGIMVAAELPIWEITPEQWTRTLGVNLDGVINGALVFVPILAAQGRPTTIVNMGSISSYSHAPWRAPYNTSKIAVAGFTEALRFELADKHPDVRVLLVCPSAVATNLTPGMAAVAEQMAAGGERPGGKYGVFLTPEEVADAIVDGLAKDEFWVFTHVGTLEAAEERMEPVFAAMERQVGHRS